MDPEQLEGTGGPVCWRWYLSVTICPQTQVGKLTLLSALQDTARSNGTTWNRWWSQLSVKHSPPPCATQGGSSSGVTPLQGNSWPQVYLLKDTVGNRSATVIQALENSTPWEQLGTRLTSPQHSERNTSCFSSFLIWVHKRAGMRKQ